MNHKHIWFQTKLVFLHSQQTETGKNWQSRWKKWPKCNIKLLYLVQSHLTATGSAERVQNDLSLLYIYELGVNAGVLFLYDIMQHGATLANQKAFKCKFLLVIL